MSELHRHVFAPVTPEVLQTVSSWAEASAQDRAGMSLQTAREALALCALRMAEAYMKEIDAQQRRHWRTLHDAVVAARELLD
jgi:hypothetical protein